MAMTAATVSSHRQYGGTRWRKVCKNDHEWYCEVFRLVEPYNYLLYCFNSYVFGVGCSEDTGFLPLKITKFAVPSFIEVMLLIQNFARKRKKISVVSHNLGSQNEASSLLLSRYSLNGELENTHAQGWFPQWDQVVSSLQIRELAARLHIKISGLGCPSTRHLWPRS